MSSVMFPRTNNCQHGLSKFMRGHGRQAAGGQGHWQGQQQQSEHGQFWLAISVGPAELLIAADPPAASPGGGASLSALLSTTEA
jgi:hypothetical protein